MWSSGKPSCLLLFARRTERSVENVDLDNVEILTLTVENFLERGEEGQSLEIIAMRRFMTFLCAQYLGSCRA